MDKTNEKEDIIYVDVADRVQAENQSATSASTVTAQLKGTMPTVKKDIKDTTIAANVPQEDDSTQQKGFLARTMDSLRERVFRRAQRNNLPSQVVFPSYANIRKVFILFESDVLERNSQIKQLVRELQSDGKTVTAWGFVDKKQVNSAILRDYRILGRQDVNLMGKPKE